MCMCSCKSYIFKQSVCGFFSCYSFAHSQSKFLLRTQSHYGTCTDDPHALLLNFITRMPCINGFLFPPLPPSPLFKSLCICFNSSIVFEWAYQGEVHLLVRKATDCLACIYWLSQFCPLDTGKDRPDQWCENKYFKDDINDSDRLYVSVPLKRAH